MSMICMLGLPERLAAIVGREFVLSDPAVIEPFLIDARGRYRGSALCVVQPATTQEVAAVVAACASMDVPIVPQGGNTGAVGGATPRGGEVVLSLARMNRIRHLDVDNNTIEVEAGCILQNLQDAAAAAGRLFPLSLAAEGSAMIGGNLSTNAGGVQVLRYGNMRELTLGLEVVLADSRIWNGLRGLRKDNTGYDLKHLFIGAEGTLGVITAAVLKLFPQHKSQATAWVALRNPEAALALLRRLRENCGERVTALEIIGRSALDVVLKFIPGLADPLSQTHEWQALIELSDAMPNAPLAAGLETVLAEAVDTGEVLDAVLASNAAQAETLWRLRESISDAQKKQGLSIKHDIAVPVSQVATLIARADAAVRGAFPGARIVCFGHVGDGNLHYNLSMAGVAENAQLLEHSAEVNRVVHDVVHELGGTISAEHGIGQLKREENRHYKSAVEIALMHAVKNAFDPDGLMNPGKLL